MKILIGNIFDTSMKTLVNTVNCVGVMGKGIALEFKKRFPDIYKEYVKLCDQNLSVLADHSFTRIYWAHPF